MAKNDRFVDKVHFEVVSTPKKKKNKKHKTKTTWIPMYGKGIMGDAHVEVSVQCLQCSKWGMFLKCGAYPKGIPKEILAGEDCKDFVTG